VYVDACKTKIDVPKPTVVFLYWLVQKIFRTQLPFDGNSWMHPSSSIDKG
jgi:hypothetical protein